MYTFKKLSILFLFTFLWSSTINVPGDYSTIQEAINASEDGDSISVAPGTYFEKINFYGKDIKVVGQDRLTTVLDGSDANSDGGGIVNGDFESYSFQNDWQYIPIGWETWLNADNGQNGPSDCCYTTAFNGENVYNSESIFYTYQGAAALKMWGWWETDNYEWNVYQNFFSDEIEVQSGHEISISAMHYQAAEDLMGDGSTFNLFVKYFDSNWNLIQMDLSDDITNQSDVNTWMERSVNSTVPDIPESGYIAIQVGMIWFNQSIGGGGAVHTDQFEMSINSIDFASEKDINPENYIQYDPSDYPAPSSRQGGDKIENAVVIDGIPYNNFGTTNGYTDDYDAECPYTGSSSPDVVYSFTASEDDVLTVSLCGQGSDYDTKLYVFENDQNTFASTAGGDDACSDDDCSNSHTNYLSIINNLEVTSGNTYYIVVDGYGGQSGSYQLRIFRDEISNVVVFENNEPNTTLLKNFTVTNGYAGGSSENNSGGGIRLSNSASPTLNNLIITENYAQGSGGGIFIEGGSSPIIKYCNVIGNTSNEEGGGLFARGSNNNDEKVTLYGCEVSGNTANRGGGFFSREIAVQIDESTFQNNITNYNDGGGLFVESAHPFEFSNSDVSYNQGSGFYINHGGGHKIRGINVSHNTGFGIGTHYTNDNLGFNISNCEVQDNDDGGIYLVGSSPVISNTYVVYNSGSTPGLQCQSGASPMLVNSTIAYNRMNSEYNENNENNGSEISVMDNSHPLLENSIIWGGNDLPDIHLNAWFYGRSSSIQIDYSIVRNDMAGILNTPINESSYGEIIWGSGNVEGVSDPMFENAENFQVNVLQGSPAIDAGNPLLYYNDLWDNTRNDIGYQGGRGIFIYLRGDNPEVWDAYYEDFNYTDFSPFYMGYAGINRTDKSYQLYIINNGNNNLTLLDWMTTNTDFSIQTYQNNDSDNFFPNVIEPSSSSWIDNVKQMWVRYSPSQPGDSESVITLNVSQENGEGYNIDFYLNATGYLIPEDVIEVPGDVPSIMFAVDNAEWHDTIKVASGTYLGKVDFREKELYLVGDKNNPPTLVHDLNMAGRQATVRMANVRNSLLKNFRIIGGEGDWCSGCNLPDGDEHSGGGVFINVDNWNNESSTVRLQNLVIENNNSMYGGGVFVRKANLQMDNCIIRDNFTYTAEYYNRNGMGGAIFMMHPSSNIPSKITNTRIESNHAHEGGAIVLWQNSWGGHKVEFENVLINGNTAAHYAGIRAMDAKFSLMNATIVDNQTTQSFNSGAGIHASNWSTARIVNSIIHNNHPYNLSVGGVDGNYDSLLVSNSIVEHGSDSIQVFQNGFVDWQNSNLNVAPDLADDYGLLNYSIGIGEGSPSGTLYGWSYTAPDTDINGGPRPNPAGSNPDIGAIENSLAQSAYRLEVDFVDCIHGDTAEVSINTLSNVSLSSIELSITGFQDQLEFLDIITDETTILGQLEWITYYNNTESLLITASAGSIPISSTGTLLKVRLAVPDDLESQFLPITITDFIGDEDFTDFVADEGGLQVVWGPESGFTSENITGAYPLTVNFNDQSMQGTYPINSWDWHFGNDSSSTDQNTSFTYLYPGEYDVSLRVEDEFGLADTILSPSLVQVDTVYGDVSWNGVVQSFDASLILKHLVDIDPFSDLQIEVGDVNLSNDISTLDAYHILEYMVGLIDALPHTPDEVTGSTGDFMMEDMGAESGMLIDVPITITNAESVNGLKGRLTYDPAVLALDTLIFGEFLNGYMIESNETQAGEILFAASGNQPNTETGTIANLTFEVLEGFYSESSVTLSDVRVNENEVLDLGAEMTINYVLGISKAGVPEVFALHQNYPNPFNPVTRINYDLPKDDLVKITIYDMMGRQVKTLINQSQTAGYRSVRWDATNNLGEAVSAGLYMYVIQAGEFRDTRKMILLK